MEPIEQWKKEFEELRSSLPSYKESEYSVMWQGFKLAKRSQPVVELPKKYWVTEYDFGESDYAYACNEVHNSLLAAGIQYRMKGE